MKQQQAKDGGMHFFIDKQEFLLENNKKRIPVITIDGPSGSGKGTIALRIAKALGWCILDSGIIYRAIAWALLYYNVSLSDTDALASLLKRIQISIKNHLNEQIKVSCDGYDVTRTIRSKECSIVASQASALFLVRSTILQYQRNFRRQPGLVADGRDMGTVVFPDAPLKFFFLTQTLMLGSIDAINSCKCKGLMLACLKFERSWGSVIVVITVDQLPQRNQRMTQW